MRKIMVVLLAALLWSHPCLAQDYSECRALCDRDKADCMSEPQASEPEEQTAKEAACSQRHESCYSQCESLKPANNDTPPESPREEGK